MDRSQARDVLSRMHYGLYIAASRDESDTVGVIVTWVSQVSFFPQLVSISLENISPLKNCIEKSGYFSLNLLPSGGKKLASSFLRPGKAMPNLINGRPVEAAAHGSPFLTEASACIECRVTARHEAGDHTILVGEVVDARTQKRGNVLSMKETGWNYQR